MKKLKSTLIFSMMAIFLLSGVAKADWDPGDGHKMHFPQMPNEAGWDVHATSNNFFMAPIVLADDFLCTESGYIKDIHFWGSWLYGGTSAINSFTLSIHADIPDGPYSRPMDPPLWEVDVPAQNIVINGPIMPGIYEGWYHPYYPEYILEDHMEYYQYNIFLDNFLPEEELFWQEADTIYWLNITAEVADPFGTAWGWKSSLDPWNDGAVWKLIGDSVWQPLIDYPVGGNVDLAFVITGEPDIPTQFPEPTICEQTECPVIQTECPTSTTRCPVVPTACPVDRTVCPADLPTVCPEEFTVCPEVYTMCPEFEPTYCQQIDTQCPDIPTECYIAETWCPWDYTWCPEDQTLCPEIHTMCPDSMPTICKFTLCPEEFTWCPELFTECPNEQTFCPIWDTMCGPPTECENSYTICPDEATWCPTRWTFCPDYPTECPVIETECPTAPTWCPDPGDFTTCAITEPTWCPEVITECPQLDTFCPDGMPGLCDITVFPMIDTVCPLDPGICPPVPDLCQDYWDKYDCCVDMVAAGREIDYNVCKGYTDQTTCEANGCTWHPDGNPLGNCILDVCLTEVSGDDKVTAPDYSVFKKEFGRAGCPCVPAPGDDLCDKYTCLYDYCIALNSLGRETDYDVCKTYTDQTTCEANGCTWHPDGNPLGNCMLDICLTEVSGDDKVTAPDYSVFKKEFGRAGCPCAMP